MTDNVTLVFVLNFAESHHYDRFVKFSVHFKVQIYGIEWFASDIVHLLFKVFSLNVKNGLIPTTVSFPNQWVNAML